MITIIYNLAYLSPPNLNIYSLEHIQILTEIFSPVTNIIILSPSRNRLSILYLEIDSFKFLINETAVFTLWFTGYKLKSSLIILLLTS